MSPDQPTDASLWHLARSGHGESFGVLFDRHAGVVHGYCRLRTAALYGGDADAADLTSVVFLEAWRRRRDVEMHQESVLPWLLGIARLVVLRHTRMVHRHRAALRRLPADSGDDPTPSVDARLDAQRRLQAAEASLARLSRPDQEVLTLCGWGGMDYAAAAVSLGVPVGTVRSRLSRARARLAALTDAPKAQLPRLENRDEPS